ncbi:hypothetical protein EDD86DRAFT_199770 [Gorgonomyces haynaldii]|nr:hypothetical protein EDD86DRAFT_199770 [Gorgonomyces haynaldii]
MSLRYTYIAAVSHGISLQHCASLSKSIYKQLSRSAQKRTKMISMPLALTLAAMLFITFTMITMIYSSWYLMYSDPNIPYTQYYRDNRYIGAITIHIPSLFIHFLILNRLFVFSKRTSAISICLSVLTALHGLSLIAVIYYTTTVMTFPHFSTAPNIRIWILVNGVCLLTDCMINVSATVIFLRHLAHELDVSISVLLWSLFFKYGGPKWGLFLGLNCFTLYVLVTSLLYGSTTASAAQYHIVILQQYLTVDIFFTSSYTAAQDLLEVASTQRDQMFRSTAHK